MPTEAVPEIWEISDWKVGFPEKKRLGAVQVCATGGVPTRHVVPFKNRFCRYGMGTIKWVPC